MDSRFQVHDSTFFDSGFFELFLDTKVQDSGFHKEKLAGLRNPDSLTWIIEPNPCECKKFSKASKRSYRIRLCGLKVVICLLLVLLQNENNWNTFDIALGKMLSTG